MRSRGSLHYNSRRPKKSESGPGKTISSSGRVVDGMIEAIDLTLPFASLNSPVWPGCPLPVRSKFLTFEESSGFNSNMWSFEEHTSTHVDAPLHVLRKGEAIDAVPLSRFHGQGFTLDFRSKPKSAEITPADIEREMAAQGVPGSAIRGAVLLFLTGFSAKFGSPEWLESPCLGEEACNFIARLEPTAIGVDAASPDREPYPAHKLLLSRGISIFENLGNLEKVIGKRFLFVGFPLRLVGGTASPVRAVALLTR